MNSLVATAIAVLGAAPLAAQSTTPATNNVATPAPATSTPPARAPGDTSVGPPQLRDFNLNGTVTQPSQPAPVPATPAPRTPTTTPATGTRPEPATAASPARSTAPAAVPAPPAPRLSAPDRDPAANAVTVDLPPATVAPPLPEPSFSQPAIAAPGESAAPPARGTANLWPWLAALLAAGLGGAFLLWRRRQGAVLDAGSTTMSASLLRQAAPQQPPRPPTPVPTPAPTPAPRAPQAAVPVPPRPATTPAPAPAPRSAPAPIPGGIVASGLKPRLELELVPVRADTDAAENAALTFDVILTNRGSAPARDILVDAQLFNAGAQVENDVVRFFEQPPAGGERVAVVAPMGRVALRMQLVAASASLKPLVVEGRKLLVPLIAINAVYRWSAGELTESASFIVGRGSAEADKLAPIRLDLGARAFSQLAARLHSTGLQRGSRTA